MQSVLLLQQVMDTSHECYINDDVYFSSREPRGRQRVHHHIQSDSAVHIWHWTSEATTLGDEVTGVRRDRLFPYLRRW